jgi:hypothetical protein
MSEEMDSSAASQNDGQKVGQGKSWYPYITKAQFEKFLARLQTAIPEQVDRDYIRAIIRTPSMIHRFLRGIEAMGLTDRDQQPTERLQRLVDQNSRKHAVAEIMQDLYPDLIDQWRQEDGAMGDSDIVNFFHQHTGMGKDSANKMKMFFKYLAESADFSTPPEPAPIAEPEPEPKPKFESEPEPTAEEQEERPQTSSRRSGRERGERGSSSRNAPQSGAKPSDQTERPAPSNRPLTELQKAYLDTVQKVVNINIDGDWDDDMIRTAFDRLERLFDRIRRG